MPPRRRPAAPDAAAGSYFPLEAKTTYTRHAEPIGVARNPHVSSHGALDW